MNLTLVLLSTKDSLNNRDGQEPFGNSLSPHVTFGALSRLVHATVLVSAVKDGQTFVGTGLLLLLGNDTYTLLTVQHVLPRGNKMSRVIVKFNTGSSSSLTFTKVVALGSGSDPMVLCYLHASRLNRNDFARLAIAPWYGRTKPGWIIYVGRARGIMRSSTIQFARAERCEFSSKLGELSVPIEATKGNSGGAVLYASRDKLSIVGVLVSSSQTGPNGYISVAVADPSIFKKSILSSKYCIGASATEVLELVDLYSSSQDARGVFLDSCEDSFSQLDCGWNEYDCGSLQSHVISSVGEENIFLSNKMDRAVAAFDTSRRLSSARSPRLRAFVGRCLMVGLEPCVRVGEAEIYQLSSSDWTPALLTQVLAIQPKKKKGRKAAIVALDEPEAISVSVTDDVSEEQHDLDVAV